MTHPRPASIDAPEPASVQLLTHLRDANSAVLAWEKVDQGLELLDHVSFRSEATVEAEREARGEADAECRYAFQALDAALDSGAVDDAVTMHAAEHCYRALLAVKNRAPREAAAAIGEARSLMEGRKPESPTAAVRSAIEGIATLVRLAECPMYLKLGVSIEVDRARKALREVG